MHQQRKTLLREWASYLISAAETGGLSGRPVAISRVQTIAGPRAGALELTAGIDAGRIKRALQADDCALARQFVPWRFTGDPSVFMSSRYVRVEAGWPPELAETSIRLPDLGQRPNNGGRWLAGKNELGQVVTLGLSDQTPHWLLAGATGSGKSIGLQAAGLQLGQDPHNRLILLDGKYGDGLGPLAHLPTRVGPLVTDPDVALGALAWATRDMQRRYTHRNDPSRLIILWDEPQEWLADSPPLVALTRRILAQGRAARVHVILATHHPTVSQLRDPTIGRNLVGRFALRVADYDASRAIVGRSDPRADRLMGAGDAYWIAPHATHRGQGVLIDDRDLRALPTGDPLLDDWPEYTAEDLGQEPSHFSGNEIGCAIVAAHLGKGRPTLRKMVHDQTNQLPGGSRSQRLQHIGRETHRWLTDHSLTDCWNDTHLQAHFGLNRA